jgi:hypothetical protein
MTALVVGFAAAMRWNDKREEDMPDYFSHASRSEKASSI